MEHAALVPSQTCLIAGCGYVGMRLARARSKESPVLAMVRRASAAADLVGQGIPALAVDLDQEGPVVPGLLPSVLGTLVYLAPPTEAGTEDLRIARFLEALGPARPDPFIYLSTTGVYGDTHGGPVDEDSPTTPLEDRSRRRLDAERRVTQWCRDRSLRCVVFRVPAIYGPHRLPLERLRRQEPVLRAEDSGPGNRIHVDDLVGACRAALRGPASGVFNLTDGLPESMADFQARLARLAGLPEPPRVSRAEAERVLPPGLWSFLRESRQITSRRMTELGWSPCYGQPGAGLRASLEEMGLAAASEEGFNTGAR